MIKKCVIPAAGFGTRFLPITKAVPKELLPIIDKPALAYIVDEAIEAGIEKICIIISSIKEDIKRYFGDNVVLEKFLSNKNKFSELNYIKSLYKEVEITYVYQEEQLGLGHAILQAKDFVGSDDFAVLLGDDVYVADHCAIGQLIEAYQKVNATILGTQIVPLVEASKYGVCIPKDVNNPSNIIELAGVVEKPKNPPSQSTISGRYILTNAIFDYLSTQTKGAGDEIQLTDAVLRLMGQQKVYAYNILGKRYDIGSKIGYVEAIIDFGLAREDLKVEVESLLQKKLSNK